MSVTFEDETYRLDDLVATDKHGIIFRCLEEKDRLVTLMRKKSIHLTLNTRPREHGGFEAHRTVQLQFS